MKTIFLEKKNINNINKSDLSFNDFIVSDLLIKLINKRNIEKKYLTNFFSEADKLFQKYSFNSFDPDIKKFCNRIYQAFLGNEKICVFGDYDVDGCCSVAILYDFLKNCNFNVDFYIPERSKGYGLSEKFIIQNKDKYNLIITVDNGSTAYKSIETALNLGIEVIVTDHHNIEEEKIKAPIFINPKKTKSSYDYLCGAGVVHLLVFSLAQFLFTMENQPIERYYPYRQYSILAMLATIADIVPLVDLNRDIVKQGLIFLNKNKKEIPGLFELIKKIGLENKTIDELDVAFQIAPAINSTGRMNDPLFSAKLLLNQNIEDYSQILVDSNIERKSVEQQAIKTIEAKYDLVNHKEAIIVKENINSGLSGIIASKIAEKYNKPTIIFTYDDIEGKTLKGSGRSIKKLNIYDIVSKQAHILDSFGGHAYALGLSLKSENFDLFRRNFNIALKNSGIDVDVKVYEYDLNLGLELINLETFNEINRLKPFGNSNENPLFFNENLTPGNLRIIKNNHIAGHFFDKQKQIYINFIHFFVSKTDMDLYFSQEKLKVLYEIMWNNFKNKVQIQVKKIASV